MDDRKEKESMDIGVPSIHIPYDDHKESEDKSLRNQ
jgi:hypothetical protein